MIGEGYTPDYLDRCTLFDMDLFIRQTGALLKMRGPRR